MIPSTAQSSVPSPCNKICTLDARHVCIGCGRSREEIGGWMHFSDAEKKAVTARASARLVAMDLAKVKAG